MALSQKRLSEKRVLAPWGPPVVLVRTGVIPDEFEAGGGVEWAQRIPLIGEAHRCLPERCANVCFGGFRRSRLFMATNHAVYSLFMRARSVWGLKREPADNLVLISH
jgi:hypothetical protein